MLCARLLTTTTWFLYGSSGARIGESLSGPSSVGVQFDITAPCGMKHSPIFIRGLATVFANGVWAGTMDSNKGRESVTPTPRMNVRRDRCFLVMKLIWSPSFETVCFERFLIRSMRSDNL